MVVSSVSRRSDIDTIRGFGIILVVLGHTHGLPEPLFRLIYSFHMPLFFILSGYLFNCEKAHVDPVGTLFNKFKRLIVPAWFWITICGLPYTLLLLFGNYPSGEYWSRFFGAYTGVSNVSFNFNSSPIWFLFALFGVEVFSLALARIRHSIFRLALFIVIGCFGVFFSQRVGSGPFHIWLSISALLFFGIGIAIREFPTGAIKVRYLILPAFFFVSVNFIFNEEVLSMATNYFSEYIFLPLTLISSLSGSLIVCFFAGKFKNSSISWIGQKTIPILAMNYYANSLVVFVIGGDYWIVTFILQLVVLLLIALASSFFPEMLGVPRRNRAA